MKPDVATAAKQSLDDALVQRLPTQFKRALLRALEEHEKAAAIEPERRTVGITLHLDHRGRVEGAELTRWYGW